jgi:4'-phosphopantetheinyl transferase
VPVDLDFNLSHSGGRLACAITSGASVGIDLERCSGASEGRDVMRLARRFFRAEEIAALERCPPDLQRDRFYDYWTLKEAAVKCRGERLVSGLDTRGFTFDAEPGGPSQAHISATLTGSADGANYCLLEPYPGYRLAVCCDPLVRGAHRLQLVELNAVGDIIFPAATLRASSRLH